MPVIEFVQNAQWRGEGLREGDQIDADRRTAEAYVRSGQAKYVNPTDDPEHFTLGPFAQTDQPQQIDPAAPFAQTEQPQQIDPAATEPQQIDPAAPFAQIEQPQTEPQQVDPAEELETDQPAGDDQAAPRRRKR